MSGGIYFLLGPKNAFTSMFLFSLVGTCLLMTYHTDENLIPVFITIAKFGISASFNMCFIAFVQLIPTIFSTSVFGMCNVLARTITCLAPVIA